jgi:DNA invertase Pin-like site-specific DNA recombinase
MTPMERDHLRAAIYARVSSEQQAKDNTIASQLEALKQRIARDGLVAVMTVAAATSTAVVLAFIEQVLILLRLDRSQLCSHFDRHHEPLRS